MTYQDKRKEAEYLRRKGYSYNLIKEKIKVSKSTLSYWLRDVPYIPNKETVARIGVARAASSAAQSKKRIESIEKARKEAQNEIGLINDRDLFMLGIGVYIGEGAKSQEQVRVINSNPQIIKLVISWFRKLGVKTENFGLAIHLYPDNNIKDCIDYWSRVTGIPKRQFGKTQVDKRIGKKMGKRGKLPHGTAHLSIRSKGNKKLGSFLARKIDGYMKEVIVQTTRV